MINFKDFIGYLFILFFCFNNIYTQNEKVKSIEVLNMSKKLQKFIFFKNDIVNISFDYLSSKNKNFYYTIDHYDYNWRKSNLFKNEFIQGYDDIRISNYERSFNTLQKFVNYSFKFPNNNFKIKLSGNYLVTVKDNKGDEVFSRKVLIIDKYNLANIKVTRPKVNNIIETHQNLKVTFNCFNCIYNSQSEYKLVVYKNNNLFDFKIINKPTFKTSKTLIYDNILFQAGDEYLNFDTKNILSSSNEIRRIESDTIYKTILYDDVERSIYSYKKDKNGIFLTNSDNINNSSESDYTLVNFSFLKKNDSDANIHIVGSFNNYNINEDSKLKKISNNLYKIKLLLKQGYYDYKYVIDKKGVINTVSNFWETENNYSAILYEKNKSERYFKIIGFGEKSSYKIVN